MKIKEKQVILSKRIVTSKTFDNIKLLNRSQKVSLKIQKTPNNKIFLIYTFIAILEMIQNETITEGMIPKINTCLDAINNEVTAVTTKPL